MNLALFFAFLWPLSPLISPVPQGASFLSRASQGGAWNMAAEAPAVEEFSDELLDEVAEQVVGGTIKDQMLGTFSGISRRLVTAHNGAVRMHAETEDPEMLFWAVTRVVSATRGWSRRAYRQMDGA